MKFTLNQQKQVPLYKSIIAILTITSFYLIKLSHCHQQHQHQQHHQQAICSLKPNPCQNGAKCMNKPGGGYQCMCVNGWEGQNCTENIDDCSSAACMNGATCIDRVGHFYCECPPGKAGLLCQLEDGCFSNPCHPNATCDTSPVDGRAVCACPPGFTGSDCSIDMDECAAGAPCEHGGTCVNKPGTFVCECPKGFSGSRCEININECDENPCMNDGSCLDEPGGYRCICMPGYTGQQCQVNIDECAANPCQNGATCKDLVNSFRCLCPAGYWGERCEFNKSSPGNVGGGGRPPPLGLNSNSNQVVDGADGNGGSLLLSPGNPWSKCSMALACWTFFNDGKCDQECNIAECLYDGNDCALPIEEQQLSPSRINNSNNNNLQTTSSSSSISSNNGQVNNFNSANFIPKSCDERSDSFCLKNYANGICDQECNSAECSWDGLDCEQSPSIDNGIMPPISNTRAQGLLVIRVEPAIKIGGEQDSRIELARLLRKVSVVTKSILKIQNYRDVDDGRGSEIELIADNRKCQSSCYNSTELIAKFLSALRARTKDFDTSMGPLKMIDFKSQDEQSRFEPNQPQYAASTVWVIVCGSLAIVCALLMVISIGNKQNVKEKAIVWFPEGFKPVLSSRNRDPTERKQRHGGGRGVSTLQALGGNFFRGMKRNDRTAVSTDPTGGQLHSTDVDRCQTSTPNGGGGIYHEPYDYDQYGSSTYNGTDSVAPHHMDHHHVEPMTPTPISMNPINMEGPHGLTPLMVASMGHPFSNKPLGLVAYGTTGEVVDNSSNENNNVTDLLNRGAQLNLTSKVTGETALHLAARCGRADNASRLLAHCDSKDVNAKDATGRTPLHAAIAADSRGVFELLIRNRGTDLNAQTHDGTTPLILAAKVGNYEMTEQLMLNECEVTKTDANGKTALHWAAAVNNVDIIRLLLTDRATNKDAQDLAEETPLFLAAREGARGAVEILLNHNANRDIKDQMDMSPMDIARSRKHDDIVRLLEEHEPPTPRSLASLHANSASSRQISPFSPDSNSNGSSTINNNNPAMPPVYHTHSQSNGGGGTRDSNAAMATAASAQGGRQAQRATIARSNSTKPLIAEANIIRNNLQSHCKSVMVIKSGENEQHHENGMSTLSSSAGQQHQQATLGSTRTLGRRATQSTSSSHQTIQQQQLHNNNHTANNMQHVSQFGGNLSANNVVTMPATPNSLTNSLSPVSTSMMSPPTHHSLHHLASPTKLNAPINISQQLPPRSHQQLSNNNQVPPPSYNECQTIWNNNNVPNIILNNNNNHIDSQTHGALSEVYNVPCLKNLMMTPSPESSPFSLESMASPTGVNNDQQYQNLRQAGVFI